MNFPKKNSFLGKTTIFAFSDLSIAATKAIFVALPLFLLVRRQKRLFSINAFEIRESA